jgi:hypothetical protein
MYMLSNGLELVRNPPEYANWKSVVKSAIYNYWDPKAKARSHRYEEPEAPQPKYVQSQNGSPCLGYWNRPNASPHGLGEITYHCEKVLPHWTQVRSKKNVGYLSL